MSWSTFIKAHWGAIAATDLFTVEVVNPFCAKTRTATTSQSADLRPLARSQTQTLSC